MSEACTPSIGRGCSILTSWLRHGSGCTSLPLRQGDYKDGGWAPNHALRHGKRADKIGLSSFWHARPPDAIPAQGSYSARFASGPPVCSLKVEYSSSSDGTRIRAPMGRATRNEVRVACPAATSEMRSEGKMRYGY